MFNTKEVQEKVIKLRKRNPLCYNLRKHFVNSEKDLIKVRIDYF